FHSSLGVMEVARIGHQLMASDPRYREAYIRKAGPEHLGLFFVYQPPSKRNVRSEVRKYLARTSADLARAYGDDLIGWDVSGPIWVLRQDSKPRRRRPHDSTRRE